VSLTSRTLAASARMSKPHASLSVTTNLLLIPAWAAVAAFFLFVAQPHAPLSIALAGIVLGILSAIMQHLSFAQATGGFTTATTLMEVRRAFTATTWGRRYIRFLYASNFILIALAFFLIRQPLLGVFFGYFAGYFSLMFAREVVTLRDTFQLHRLTTNAPNSEPNAT
jgi:hypothetical protein